MQNIQKFTTQNIFIQIKLFQTQKPQSALGYH